MKWNDLLTEGQEYSVNWVRPDLQNLELEYKYEYLLPSRNWDRRCQSIGAEYPLFDDQEDFNRKILSAPVINITPEMRVTNMTHCSSIEGVRDLVSGYQFPRDVDRIIDGFQRGADMPLPIIIKGTNGMWILSGNTRSNLAMIHGIPLKAIVYDASDSGEQLNELFDKSQDLKIVWEHGNYSKDAYIELPNQSVHVEFSRVGPTWSFIEINFAVNGKMTITDKGNAINVFNAVLKCCDEYMKNTRKPQSITFVASLSEPSRVKLYKRMANRLAQSYGYFVIDRENKKHNEHMFRLMVDE